VSFSQPDDGTEYPPSCRWKPEWVEYNRTGYYAQIENLDDNIGRLTDCLRETGLADNTVLFFFSDHGELLGSHGMRSKQDPREESVNIPLIVCAPGGPLTAGATIDEPVCTEDLFPTTLAAAGLPVPAGLPGLDLMPLLRGETDSLPREGVRLEFCEEHRPTMVYYRRPWRAFRTKRWKYTVVGGKPTHLFDLRDDPFELRNRIRDAECRETVRRLHRCLAESCARAGDPATFEPPEGTEP
jgi:arylsulfatase A-like enzyme